MLECFERDLRGLRGWNEAQRANGLEPHPRLGVVDHPLQDHQAAVHAIEPVLKNARRRGACAELPGLQHGVEDFRFHRVVMFVDPQGFEQVVLVAGIGGIEAFDPFFEGGHDRGRRARTQRKPGLVPGAIFVSLQQLELSLDRLALDPRPLVQGPALRRDAPDAAVDRIAPRVPQRVLHVSDQRIEPVGDVERPVEPEFDRNRPEVRIRRHQQRFGLHGDEPGAVLPYLVLLDALEADRVRHQEIALGIVGKVAAADELHVRGRPYLGQRPHLHRPLLAGIVDVAGERRAVVVVSVGRVGDEVLTPPIDDVAPGIGEAVADEHAELFGARFVSEDARFLEPHRAVRCFDLRMEKGPFLEIQVAARTPGEGVDGVMAVFSAEAVQHDAALVGFAVSVRVAQEHQVGLLRDVRSAIPQLETRRNVEAVGKHPQLVGAPVLIGILQDDQLVVRRHARQYVRVGGRREHPEPSTRVERHRQRVGDFRKLLLRGEKRDLVALGRLQPFEGDLDVDRSRVERATAIRFRTDLIGLMVSSA